MEVKDKIFTDLLEVNKKNCDGKCVMFIETLTNCTLEMNKHHSLSPLPAQVGQHRPEAQ